MAEFQYNNHVYIFTQQYTFFLDAGCLLCMGFKSHQQESEMEGVMKFIV